MTDFKQPDPAFWRGKRVLLTGHTGFKGSWMSLWLKKLDGHYAIGNFIHDALYNKQIIIQGDGSPVRSYLYGADLAVWLLKILLVGQKGESYNVGSDEALTLKELATLVRDVLSPNKQIEIQQNTATSSSSTRNRYVPAIDRARALGCVPWTKLDESLRLTANFLYSH